MDMSVKSGGIYSGNVAELLAETTRVDEIWCTGPQAVFRPGSQSLRTPSSVLLSSRLEFNGR